jgi:hypothetical protein
MKTLNEATGLNMKETSTTPNQNVLKKLTERLDKETNEKKYIYEVMVTFTDTQRKSETLKIDGSVIPKDIKERLTIEYGDDWIAYEEPNQ